MNVQLELEEEKIKKIIDGWWEINQQEFLVEIEIEIMQKSRIDQYCRIINQNELSAIETQINISNLSKESNIYSQFVNIYRSMKEYHKAIIYLYKQGMASFEKIRRKPYSFFNRVFDTKLTNFEPIYSKVQKTQYLSDFIKDTAFRIIGNYVQRDENPYFYLIPYLISILGFFISEKSFLKYYESFLTNIQNEILFDSWKLGQSFCAFFSRIEKESKVKYLQSDSDLIDSIQNLKDPNDREFASKIRNAYFTKNLFLIKVMRPSHTYHCIKSLPRIIFKEEDNFIFNENSIIFCQNGGNFSEKLRNIPKSVNNDFHLDYFIVHPEMLNEEDQSLLIEFLNLRMSSVKSKGIPKVFVVTSLNYRQLCFGNSEDFDEIEFVIGKELIEIFAKLAHTDDSPEKYMAHLYYSDEAGAGKTYQICQDYKEIVKQMREKITKSGETFREEEFKMNSLFIDDKLANIPRLNYEAGGYEIYCNFVHFDLSPYLFDNNYKFFDDLWIFTVLHYHFYPDGTSAHVPSCIFYEVPKLSEKQFPEGGFISQADFPLYVNEYHKISTSSGDSRKMPLSDKIMALSNVVFRNKITNTMELFLQAASLFYPGVEIIEKRIVPRILFEIGVFLNNFCEGLDENNEMDVAIFILLLRTNFYVWNMESVFKDNQPKSFIILSNQSLFTKNIDRKKWILLSFTPKGEDFKDWDTNLLKDNLKEKLQNVNDVNLLEKELFKPFTESCNIEIYSNSLNYANDQVIFYKIIQTFFYINPDPKSEYSRITDGVILNYFKQSSAYESVCNDLNVIMMGKNYVKHSMLQWLPSFDIVSSILKKREYNCIDSYNIIEKLTERNEVEKICKTKLTMPMVKRFIIMIIRLVLRQPIIFEGFTGVGKTFCISLLNKLIDISLLKNDEFHWRFHQINCHGALQLEEVLRTKYWLCGISNRIIHIFFFDELNTSPVSSYIINDMTNHYLKKEFKIFCNKIEEPPIVYIASINPYLKVDKFTRSLSRVGIKQVIPNKISRFRLCNVTPTSIKKFYDVEDLNELAYNVKELSDTTKMIVLKSDPELFIFDEEDKLLMESINPLFTPPDEIQTIGRISLQYFDILINMIDENKSYEVESDIYEYFISTVTSTLSICRDQLINIMVKLLSISFSEIRQLMLLRSVLSYRDVKRFMQFFIHFFHKLLKISLIGKTISEDNIDDLIPKIIVDNIIPSAIVLAMMISIVFRFSDESKIDLKNGTFSKSEKRNQEIEERCKKFGLLIRFSKDKSYCKVNIRSTLINKLMSIDWSSLVKDSSETSNIYLIKNPSDDWMRIVISYSWLKCSKYIYHSNFTHQENSSIFKLNSLMIHLFGISSCYSASKRFRDSVIPCLIVGMPGTSKTLAVQFFTSYKQNNENFFSTTYLSTRVSEAEGLNAHYRDCAMFMMKNEENYGVCVIDELGLANLNETRPLKLLHYYFDSGIEISSRDKRLNKMLRVISFASSNYALDYSNMNRGTLICTDLPNDDDMAEAFCFSELESKEDQITSEKLEDFQKKFFENNNFFSWKLETKASQRKYKIFLSELWKMTENQERPEMLTLRPLYMLFNTIFNTHEYMSDSQKIANLCIYITSAISCKPSDSFQKVSTFLQNLKMSFEKNSIDDENINNLAEIIEKNKRDTMKVLEEIVDEPVESIFRQKFDKILLSFPEGKLIAEEFRTPEKIHESFQNHYQHLANNVELFNDLAHQFTDPRYDNYKLLKQSIMNNGSRALCFRTKNYECLDFVELLINKISENYQPGTVNHFHKIFPSYFKVPVQLSTDDSIEEIINCAIDQNANPNSMDIHYFLFIGNVTLTDSLLDLLNSATESKGGLPIDECPIISRNGFSVQFPSFPSNINFCFVMNEKDFSNKNSAEAFPVPLLDRLNQITLDYEQDDAFGIIKSFRDFRAKNESLSRPSIEIVHDYLMNFVSDIDAFYKNRHENGCVSVLFASEGKFDYSSKPLVVPYDLEDKRLEIDWGERKKIILLFYRSALDEINYTVVRTNLKKVALAIEKFRNSNCKVDVCWSDEFNELFAFFANAECCVPFPYPSDYCNLRLDCSINNFVARRRRETNESQVKSIILTTSPMMKELKFGGCVRKDSTTVIVDNYIVSVADFAQNLHRSSQSTKSIVVQSNQFQIEHDRLLRHLLEAETGRENLIIIYYLKDSKVPEGIYTSKGWNVCWIESVIKSPIDQISTEKLVDSILFDQMFGLNRKEIFTAILYQIYEDYRIPKDRKIEKLDFIFNKLLILMTHKKVNFSPFVAALRKETFLEVDIKKQFKDILKSAFPLLANIIKSLVLLTDRINTLNEEETDGFLKEIVFDQE